MSDLHETISEAKDKIQAQEQSGRDSQKPDSKPNNTLPMTVAALIITLGLSILLGGTTEDEVQADMPVALVDMLMEADGSVHIYYQSNGELPETLPLEPLSHFVRYEKLNKLEYSLNLVYEDYNEKFILDINSPPSPELIRTTLGL